MKISDPRAIYIHCDGAMDYDKENSGGVGYEIIFPDFVGLESIREIHGRYVRANIERLELEGLIRAFEAAINLFKENKYQLRQVGAIIFITDRFRLQESEGTSPYKIREWRGNNWKNHEGKPIKNHDLLDELDKKRRKLIDLSFKRVNIEFRPRKQNKGADKLAKAGKKLALRNDKLEIQGNKIGRRKYDGAEVTYHTLNQKQSLHIHIFRKTPVGNEWEVACEICDGEKIGKKIMIYADDLLAAKLKRLNEYSVRVKAVHKYHIRIFRTIKNVKRK